MNPTVANHVNRNFTSLFTRAVIKAERELALKVFVYDVKQVLMVRYARDGKVALWVNV